MPIFTKSIEQNILPRYFCEKYINLKIFVTEGNVKLFLFKISEVIYALSRQDQGLAFCLVLLLLQEFFLNPLMTTHNYSYTHFCRFLAVLEYSPIGVKFPPTIAWRILYTVKKKYLKIFKTFLVLKVLKHLGNFLQKLVFFILF